jgi:hypothetical protein
MDPQHAPIVKALTGPVASMRKDPHAQIRVRVGDVHSNGDFIGSVPYAYHHQLFASLTDPSSYGQWSPEPEKVFTTRRYYRDQIRCTFHDMADPQTFRVRTKDSLLIECANRRLGLNTMVLQHVPQPEFKENEHSTHVRALETCILQQGMWSYEFTKTSKGMGSSVQSACGIPQFWVDLVLRRDGEFNNMSDQHLADHLLGRSLQLLGCYNAHGVKEKLMLSVCHHKKKDPPPPPLHHV